MSQSVLICIHIYILSCRSSLSFLLLVNHRYSSICILRKIKVEQKSLSTACFFYRVTSRHCSSVYTTNIHTPTHTYTPYLTLSWPSQTLRIQKLPSCIVHCVCDMLRASFSYWWWKGLKLSHIQYQNVSNHLCVYIIMCWPVLIVTREG